MDAIFTGNVAALGHVVGWAAIGVTGLLAIVAVRNRWRGR